MLLSDQMEGGEEEKKGSMKTSTRKSNNFKCDMGPQRNSPIIMEASKSKPILKAKTTIVQTTNLTHKNVSFQAPQTKELVEEKTEGLEEEEKQELEETITDIFDNFKLNWASLLFNFLFIIRRQVMVATLIFMPKHGIF